MKDKIMDLVRELGSLNQPYTLESLTLIFDKYKELFAKDVKPPEKLAAIWYALRNIRTQLTDWQQLVTEQQDVVILQAEINKSLVRLDEVETRSSQIQDSILQQQGHLDNVCPGLVKAYNDHLIAQDPLIAVNTPNNFRQQQHLLNTYLEILQTKLHTIETETTRLKVAEALLMRKELVIQLKKLNIIVTDNSSDASQIFEKLTLEKEDLSNLKLQLEKSQQELAENISLSDVQEEIGNKTRLIEEMNAELLSVDSKIKKSTLVEDIRLTLENDYQLATDKEQFIAEQEEAVNWYNSSFNPSSWYSWGMDPSFKTNLSQRQSELHYLQLLHQHEQLTAQIVSLTQYVSRTEGYIKTSSVTPKSNNSISQLQEEVVNLLSEFNSRYSPTNVNKVTLLTDVIDSLGPLCKKIDVFDYALRILPEIIALDRSILELRMTQSLVQGVESFMLTPEELSKLQNTESVRQKELSTYLEKIKDCKTCLNAIQTIANLDKELKELRNEKRSLKLDLKYKKAKQVSLPDCSNHEVKKEQAQHFISLQITNLDTTLQEIVSKTEEPLRQEAQVREQVISEKFNILISYQDNLNSWNRFIRDIKHPIPLPLQEWYQQLFIALQTHVRDEMRYNQACQLLRDIYFELNTTGTSAKYTVLSSYQTLCPNPHNSWQILTNLKPSFPIGKEQLAEVKHQTLRDGLNALYQQQKILAMNYPREGELLRQAIYNLHQGCLLFESNPNHPALKNLKSSMDDPRYEALQKHRGFYKICEWLAQLCTTLLAFIRKNQDTHYRQLFFFKPTQTAKLLDNINTELINCMAG
ncbi:hypothetical protein [Legionella brunensis]|uniref:Interaptin n=1 Tax=Legionella brunensis TaxID=29422 RepID=A0A0W0S0B6_9GAMM|nr:hypothetical protein [Legionella brunensis]KTC76876.1 interaptin [Legionella brunensis]